MKALWNTIKSSLGLVRPLKAAPLRPLIVSNAAKRLASNAPQGQCFTITLSENPRGWGVQVKQVPRREAEGLEEVATGLFASPSDLPLLAGVTLSVDKGQWITTAPLQVSAAETPNPNGRLYTCDRLLAEGRIFGRQGDPGMPPVVQDLLSPDVVSVLVRDNTVTLERIPSAPWPEIDDHCARILKLHAANLGQPLRAKETRRADPLEAAVWATLETSVLPGLWADGGDLVLLGIDDGMVSIQFQGACVSCPASSLTVSHGIERVLLEEFPDEIFGVTVK